MQSFNPLLLLQPSSIFTSFTWLCALCLEHNVWLDSNLLGERNYLFLWHTEAPSISYLLKLFHTHRAEWGMIFCLSAPQLAIFIVIHRKILHQHIILDKLCISNDAADSFTTPGLFILEEENKQTGKQKTILKTTLFYY